MDTEFFISIKRRIFSVATAIKLFAVLIAVSTFSSNIHFTLDYTVMEKRSSRTSSRFS